MTPDYDVFLSYPHADAGVVRPIADALRACGLRVFIDTEEIADFASITRSIEQGLARSKALLAYYSTSYRLSRACQWELTTAFLAAEREGDAPHRILVVNPHATPAHIQPVQLQDRLFQTAPDAADASSIAELAARVAEHVGGISTPLGAVRPVTPPQWYGQAPTGSTRFVGRVDDLWKIHTTLSGPEPVIITGARVGIAQLRGLGGIGKTLAAEEYALRFSNAYPGGVFWLRAYGNDGLRGSLDATQLDAERVRQLADLAQLLGKDIEGVGPVEVEALVRHAIETRGAPCLWVVDDLPEGLSSDEFRRWLAPHPLARTLVTTRSHEHDAVSSVDLGGLDPDEALRLLTRGRALAANELDEARRVGDALGHHALALDVAGALIEANRGLQTIAEFRAALADASRDELELAEELRDVLPTGHEKSISATLLRSVEKLSEGGRDFLRLAACLPAAPIPARLVADVFRIADALYEDAARRRAMAAMGETDALGLSDETEPDLGARSVHVLVSRTLRFRDCDPERREALRSAALRSLAATLEAVVDPRHHDALRREVALARELAARAKDTNEANVLQRVARHDYERGLYGSARTLYANVLATRRRVFGEEHSDTFDAMNNLALTFHALGDLAGARTLQEAVLVTCRRVLGEEHPDTLTAISNLAVTFHAQGDLAGARTLQEAVLATRRRVLGEEHSDTVKAMSNLAFTLHAQGDLAGARTLQEAVLAIRRRVLGEEHPDTFTVMNNLAGTIHAQGDLAGARTLQEAVLVTCRRVLGEEHPHTLIGRNNLAATLTALGDLAGARTLQEAVLATCRRVLGEEHSETLTVMSNLAATLHAQGDLAGARTIQEAVLATRSRVLGEEHRLTLRATNDLAGTLEALGDLAGARTLFETTLVTWRHVLGEEHPDTLTVMSNLALTFHAQGDLAGARTLQEAVLATCRRVLGEEHPDTLTAMNNLAGTLHAQGDFAAARTLQEAVLATRRRVLGEEHSDTLVARNNLAGTLEALGDLAGARTLHEATLVTWRRVLGEEHPDTLAVMSNLAYTVWAQGERKRAIELMRSARQLGEHLLGVAHPDVQAMERTLKSWTESSAKQPLRWLRQLLDRLRL